MPPNHKQKGDHYVSFKIEIPKNISDEQRKAIEMYAKVEPKVSEASM